MSLLYGKLNKELKLLGSVQTQLHTHVNMFICKPLDYIPRQAGFIMAGKNNDWLKYGKYGGIYENQPNLTRHV